MQTLRLVDAVRGGTTGGKVASENANIPICNVDGSMVLK
jgi:hypothetical protein